MSNPSIMYGLSGDPSPGHPSSRAVAEKLASPSITMGACGVPGSSVSNGGSDGGSNSGIGLCIKKLVYTVDVKMIVRLTAIIIVRGLLSLGPFFKGPGGSGHTLELFITSCPT
ncbi:MAG: hypothetical protein ACFFDD_14630, partial [Promethearchaeota archaeon]